MTRWIMIALTVAGLGTAILTRSPGLLGLALLATLIGLFGTVLSLAADRISANSRPDSTMLPPEALASIRDKAATVARDTAHAKPEPASRPAVGSRPS
jgi:hypothetical protein